MQQKNKQTTAKGILILVVGICVSPLLVAWLLYNNQSWFSSTIQHGQLIDPAIPVNRKEFVGLDRFSADNIGELQGHWVLVHFISDRGCGGACRESLEKTRRVRLMLNKDLFRIRRVAVLIGEISRNHGRQWWKDDRYLLRANATAALRQVAQSTLGNPIPEGTVIIMDPIGNFMMWYPATFDPYGLKKDLSRLLRVSQIG